VTERVGDREPGDAGANHHHAPYRPRGSTGDLTGAVIEASYRQRGFLCQPRAMASTQTVIARISGTSWFSASWTP
jgi:hypothetical protein